MEPTFFLPKITFLDVEIMEKDTDEWLLFETLLEEKEAVEMCHKLKKRYPTFDARTVQSKR